MRLGDAWLGALLLVAGLGVFLVARTYPPTPGQDYGAAVFPMLVSLGLAGCGGALAAQGALSRAAPAPRAAWTRSPGAWGRLALALALIGGYLAFADALGFQIVAFVLLVVLMVSLGTRPWVAALVALAVTFVTARAFAGGLLVPLPRGVLWL